MPSLNPVFLWLRTLVTAFPDPDTGWLALAMASTLAGNLTITGSVANIIVAERAAAGAFISASASTSAPGCR